ncbi:hypothetical protein ASPTUDRAFT_42972 [Aspergillus tubingensis CBS 134.48]|uniref:Uncharacterized protein n=1 Tax=Aspergillus tubingensis (strain CBS 134.48) TaxID=767770 RepID=A0A1L9N4H5_ASPTC|nr:hypothetical protein ASPTUDRAFT_42972 [Aspergillus tubingensis CBS 134.48]
MNLDRLELIEKERREVTGKPALTMANTSIEEFAEKLYQARKGSLERYLDNFERPLILRLHWHIMTSI